jgi:catabolite regulation protein CreA
MRVAESFSLTRPIAATPALVLSRSTARWSKEAGTTAVFCDENSRNKNYEISKHTIGQISRKNTETPWFFPPLSKAIRTSLVAATLMVLSSSTQSPLPALATEGSRVVGEISGSGLVFKDTLRVESFDDPKVKGVTLYLTNFERPLTERLQKDFFSDPSASSLTCVRSGPLSIADTIGTGTSGEVRLSGIVGKYSQVLLASASFLAKNYTLIEESLYLLFFWLVLLVFAFVFSQIHIRKCLKNPDLYCSRP